MTSYPHIKNPLTIVAIFAGIAEISGTVVITHLTERDQGIFVWFLIGFPVLLILFFFLTLNFNHKVLYAPSDFEDEENFMKVNQNKGADQVEYNTKALSATEIRELFRTGK